MKVNKGELGRGEAYSALHEARQGFFHQPGQRDHLVENRL